MRKLTSLLHSPDAGLLVIRVMVGIVGLFHGSQKLFGAFGGPGIKGFAHYLEPLNIPMPVASAYAAALTELVGGALVLVGLFQRLAALPWIFAMLVAFFMMHKGKFDVTAGGGEYALTLAAVLLGLVFTGPGRWSIDRIICGPAAGPSKV